VHERGLTRRVLLRGAAAGSAAAAALASAGCSSERRPPAARPAQPDPDVALLGELIAGKERFIALYRQAAAADPELAETLRPFERRHRAHLEELRRRLPPGVSPTPAGRGGAGSADASAASPRAQSSVATADPGDGSAEPSPSPSAPKVTVARLRAAERAAAAARPRQLATVSPSLAQLVACIGACEAAHVVALAATRSK
jgi:hypothetical protein